MLRIKSYIVADGTTMSGLVKYPEVDYEPKGRERKCRNCVCFDEGRCLLPLVKGELQYQKTRRSSVLSKDGVTDWFEGYTPHPNKTTEDRSCGDFV